MKGEQGKMRKSEKVVTSRDVNLVVSFFGLQTGSMIPYIERAIQEGIEEHLLSYILCSPFCTSLSPSLSLCSLSTPYFLFSCFCLTFSFPSCRLWCDRSESQWKLCDARSTKGRKSQAVCFPPYFSASFTLCLSPVLPDTGGALTLRLSLSSPYFLCALFSFLSSSLPPALCTYQRVGR